MHNYRLTLKSEKEKKKGGGVGGGVGGESFSDFQACGFLSADM